MILEWYVDVWHLIVFEVTLGLVFFLTLDTWVRLRRLARRGLKI